MAIYRIVAQFKFNGNSDNFNVQHFDFPLGVPSVAQLQAAIDDMDDGYKVNLQGSMRPEMDLEGYEVRRVDIGDQPSTIVIPTAGVWQGTSSGNNLPPQTCALVTFRAFTTFPRTARTYLPSFSNLQLGVLGTLTQTAADNCGLWAATQLILDLGDGNSAFKVTVRYGGTPRVVTAFNRVTSASVNALYATQRNRVPGVGS